MVEQSKSSAGNYFEDFRVGQELAHAIPRTVTVGDVALNTAFYGGRFVFNCADPFAQSLGLARAPVDDLLVLAFVLGKTVTDISLNAVANLGYSDLRFHALVYPGDTLGSTSRVIGLKENGDRKTGIVYVHSIGLNQHGEVVCDLMRWVMINKGDADAPAPETVQPDMPDRVPPETLYLPPHLNADGYDTDLSGSDYLWDDYEVGEKIDHIDGMTMEEAEHMMMTRLNQNTARVHSNQRLAEDSRWKRRLVFGGHVMSTARALSHNGLANAFKIAAINGGAHTNPAFAGDTVYAWSEVLEKADMPNHADFGALRLRTVATKDEPCAKFPHKTKDGKYEKSVLMDLDYWALMPRR